MQGTLTFGGRGTKTERRAAIFGQCVSGMTGQYLIFTCKLTRLKSVLGVRGHPTGAYGRKHQKVAVVVRVSLVFSLCKTNCHVLNVII